MTSEPILRAEHLAVRYRNGAMGIQDVSLDVHRGQVVALLGLNGAGKSTTVRALSGFLRSEGAHVTRGCVTLRGRDITGREPHVAANLGIAVVPERVKVFTNMSVMENLIALNPGQTSGTAKGRRRSRADGLARVFDLFPILQSRSHAAAGKLSGGERQMLALARATLMDPVVMLVDEMTLGLHVSLHSAMFDVVERLARSGTAILVVDERTTFALQLSDYCYILEGGRVRAQGSPAALSNDRLFALA